jgi:antitoxin (DNA-binding transcriptional repressor) of toxin-antitoxin stability system
MFVLAEDNLRDSNRKGAVAEIEILLAAMKLGVPVLKPVAEHGRVDLALDIGGKLWRVQCKWGALSAARDVITVHVGSSRLSSRGYVRTTYSVDEVDMFGVYCGELDRAFLLPAARFAGMYMVSLRLTPPRDGQRACINLADDFDFEGAIAQLEERCHGMAEVVGSSPTSSTAQVAEPITMGSEAFRVRLGEWMHRAAAGEEILVTYRGRSHIRLGPAAGGTPPTPPAASPPRTPRRDCR